MVNVADARDLRLDLNVGYFARLLQKFRYARCKCCKPCCSATLDTSDSQAASGSCFHAVSIRHVSANPIRC